MDRQQGAASQLFINQFDPSVRASLLGLDQKLRGFRAELDAKRREEKLGIEQQWVYTREELNQISSDLDMSIDVLDRMFNLAALESKEEEEEFFHSSEMEYFNLMVSDVLQKVNQARSLI